MNGILIIFLTNILEEVFSTLPICIAEVFGTLRVWEGKFITLFCKTITIQACFSLFPLIKTMINFNKINYYCGMYTLEK